MAQIWFRKNKAAEKYSEEDIIKILEDTLAFVERCDGTIERDDEGNPVYDEEGEPKRRPLVRLKTEVDHYMLKQHGVPTTTATSWFKNIHSKNKSITNLKECIDLVIENRLVYDQKIRPNIQALVLQNKHSYREKKEVEQSHTFNKLPSIKVDGEELNIDIGD
jgi:hypothetical protein